MSASNQLSGGSEGSRVHSLPFEVLLPVRNGQRRQPRTAWQKPDLSVPIIEPNRVVFHSQSRFGSWRNTVSRKFLEQSFGVPEVREVEIDTLSRTATLSFKGCGNTKRVLAKIAREARLKKIRLESEQLENRFALCAATGNPSRFYDRHIIGSALTGRVYEGLFDEIGC